MKKHLKSILTFLLLTSSLFCYSQDIKNLVEKDPVVGHVLGAASDDIQQLIASAARNGDYVLETNLARVQVMINNLQYSLSNDLDKKIYKIKDIEKDAIYSINDLISKAMNDASKKFMSIKDFTAMDLTEALGAIPFIKNKLYINNIDGIGQLYKSTGFFSVTVLGTPFQIENLDSVYIDGTPLTDDAIFSVDRKNSFSFNIPSGLLAKKFQNENIVRVPFRIVTYQRRNRGRVSQRLKPVYAYTGKLILLPKFPITKYKLTLSSSEKRWSTETFESSQGHLLLNPTPGKNQTAWGRVSTSVGAGNLIIKDQVTITHSPDRIWCGCSPKYEFDDNTNTVTANCMHQYSDASTDFYIQVKYRKPIDVRSDTRVYLESDGRPIFGGLKFKTYIYKLPEDYGSYVLEIVFFNGESITLTPGKNEKSGVSVREEGAGGDFKNLIVDITEQN